MTEPGTYLELDGRPAVRFVRRYPHPVERVWAAVTTPAGLAHWFPARVELDLRVFVFPLRKRVAGPAAGAALWGA